MMMMNHINNNKSTKIRNMNLFSLLFSLFKLSIIRIFSIIVTVTAIVDVVSSSNEQQQQGKTSRKGLLLSNEQTLDLILERLSNTMNRYVRSIERIEQLHKVQTFSNYMKSYDIQSIVQYLYTETLLTNNNNKNDNEAEGFQLYFSFDDGTFYNIDDTLTTLYYSEPGYSGYQLINDTTSSDNSTTESQSNTRKRPENPLYLNHYESCINEHGEMIPCIMEYNMTYVQCVNQCELIPCLHDDIDSNNTNNIINKKQSWCRHYMTQTITQEQHNNQSFGYIPRNKYCLNRYGTREERPGYVVQLMNDKNNTNNHPHDNNTISTCTNTSSSSSSVTKATKSKMTTLGTCYYTDGYTIVNSSTSSISNRDRRFSMCGDKSLIHGSNTFVTHNSKDDNNVIDKCPIIVGDTNHISSLSSSSSIRYFLNNYHLDDNNNNNSTSDKYYNDDNNQDDTPTCNTAMYGRYQTDSFDHRYRDWYLKVRNQQMSSWTVPFVVWGTNHISIRYSIPLYETITSIDNIDSKTNDTTTTKPPQVNDLLFVGVLSGGFYLKSINDFLKKQYSNTNNIVFIVEIDEPHFYMIGESIIDCNDNEKVNNNAINNNNNSMLGIVRYVLITNETIICPIEQRTNVSYCTIQRVSIYDYVNSSNPLEKLMYQSFTLHEANNFALSQVNVKEDPNEISSNVYTSQYSVYQHGNDLKWYVFVLIPMPRSTRDAIHWIDPNSDITNTGNNNDTTTTAATNNNSFTTMSSSTTSSSSTSTTSTSSSRLSLLLVCFLATTGVFVCMTLFTLFYRKRKEKTIIYSDYRFTSIFLFQSSMFNMSSYTLLGDNTNFTCILRMWSFHLLFVCVLSPLFVKVWRMAKLLNASAGFTRTKITNVQALMYTLPMIIVEIILLTIVSFLDPPLPTDEVGVNSELDGIGTHVVVCSSRSHAFAITQSVYSGLLILVGCGLAYKTRDLDPKFGEAKQLAFAMYNIAFTGLILFSVMGTIDLDQVNKIIFQTVGVLYASSTCCLAFVMPRLLQLKKEVDKRKSRERERNTDSSNPVSITEESTNTSSARYQKIVSVPGKLVNGVIQVVKLPKKLRRPPPLISESFLAASNISGWESSCIAPTSEREQVHNDAVATAPNIDDTTVAANVGTNEGLNENGCIENIIDSSNTNTSVALDETSPSLLPPMVKNDSDELDDGPTVDDTVHEVLETNDGNQPDDIPHSIDKNDEYGINDKAKNKTDDPFRSSSTSSSDSTEDTDDESLIPLLRKQEDNEVAQNAHDNVSSLDKPHPDHNDKDVTPSATTTTMTTSSSAPITNQLNDDVDVGNPPPPSISEMKDEVATIGKHLSSVVNLLDSISDETTT